MSDAELIAKAKKAMATRTKKHWDEIEWACMLLRRHAAGKGQDNEPWRAALKVARAYLEGL